MSKPLKIGLIVLVSIPVTLCLAFLLLWLGAYIYYWGVSKHKTADEWTVEIDGEQILVSPTVFIETKDTPPFGAQHREGVFQKSGYLCNCIVDSDEPRREGYGRGTFGIGNDASYWQLPAQDDVPFRMRFIPMFDTLIRQRVTYQWFIPQIDSHMTLDWYIRIYGWLSEDGKHYFWFNRMVAA